MIVTITSFENLPADIARKVAEAMTFEMHNIFHVRTFGSEFEIAMLINSPRFENRNRERIAALGFKSDENNDIGFYRFGTAGMPYTRCMHCSVDRLFKSTWVPSQAPPRPDGMSSFGSWLSEPIPWTIEDLLKEPLCKECRYDD